MKLFRLLVETFLKNGGGVDWRFCVLAASILSDIAMNNATKGGSKPQVELNSLYNKNGKHDLRHVKQVF